MCKVQSRSHLNEEERDDGDASDEAEQWGQESRSEEKGSKEKVSKRKYKRTKTRSTKAATHGAAHRSSHGKRKWSAGVNTDSTHPDEGLFKKDAATIARSLASKKVSPKGPSSGMRMLTFYVNRAGKNLPASRLRVLEHAKELLHERIEKTKKSGRSSTARHSH